MFFSVSVLCLGLTNLVQSHHSFQQQLGSGLGGKSVNSGVKLAVCSQTDNVMTISGEHSGVLRILITIFLS